MRTDDTLPRELSAAFHSEADPVARMTRPPDDLLRQVTRYRRRRAAIRTGGLTAAAAAAAVALAAGAFGPAPARAPAATATKPPPAGRHHGSPSAGGPATSRPHGGDPAGTLLSAAVAAVPSAGAAASGMPSFYAVADHGQPGVQIRDAVTGRLLSTTALPAAIDSKLTLVSASGDDRTFALAAFALGGGTRFYELKVTASGQASGLAPLPVPPVPAGEGVRDIALSPDGTRLAVVIQKTGMQGTMPVVKQEIVEVADPATGAVRAWSASGDALLTDLTWDTTGRQLAYFYAGGNSQTAGLWRLDTTAPGTALLSGQRLLPETVGPDQVQDALLTPDGQHIIASVTLNSLSHVTAGTVVGGIVQLSAQGHPLQTLLAQRAIPAGRFPASVTSCQLASVDPAGDHLLVSCSPDTFGRLDRARFTALPIAGPAGVSAATW